MLAFVFLFVTQYSSAHQSLCDFPVPAYTIGQATASGITHTSFDTLMNEIEHAYAPIFKKHGCTFVLHRSWSDDTVNAQAWIEGSECHVEMFGGLARFPGITKGAMRKVVLHEIGHHLGGAPYYQGEDLSCEGQADLYSGAVYHSAASDLRLTEVLSVLNEEPKPTRPGPRLTAVRSTYCSHPHAQCRLNTYDAGRLGKPRPTCWFKP